MESWNKVEIWRKAMKHRQERQQFIFDAVLLVGTFLLGLGVGVLIL